MSRKALMLTSASVATLFAAMPAYVPGGWYGGIDAGWHYGDWS